MSDTLLLHPSIGRPADRLPLSPLLALAMTGFTAILTETLPAGLLPRIAEGLGVAPALAGQLVTSYAIGSLVAAIPLTTLAQRWRRKPTLLAAILGLLVFNTVTALSSDYGVTLAARFLAGVAAGLAWGILAGYARMMVVDRLQGRALAVAMVGTPVALSLGVPVGTFLGAGLGWRAAFLVMSATTVVLVAWVARAVPDFPGRAVARRVRLSAVFLTPGVRPILAVIVGWMTAHNVLYTYVAPLAERAGLAEHVGLLLLGFGLTSLLGIWATGLLVDRWLRRLVLSSLGLFCAVGVAVTVAGRSPGVFAAATLLWGLSFGGAATLLQTAIADAARDGVDLANAMVTTVWNMAIAGGGVLGGVLLHLSGPGTLAPAALLFIFGAVAIAVHAHRHGFTSGPRFDA